MKKKIAIIGGGPSALFLFKHLVQSGNQELTIMIFESQSEMGKGMPYGDRGSNQEHVTNVSGNEIPDIAISLLDWLQTVPAEIRDQLDLPLNGHTNYKVLPRLLFGQYLSTQFDLLYERAVAKGITVEFYKDTTVTDVTDNNADKIVTIHIGSIQKKFDHVIICTGHHWIKTFEGKSTGYFDSPYPPVKLKRYSNHAVAIRGSSLTAIDAIRTLARYNGRFEKNHTGKLLYHADENSFDFKIILHSRNGLLPCVRFHLDDPHLAKDALLSKEELEEHIQSNDGFLSLDYIFEKDFKDSFKEKDPSFYDVIKDHSIEQFVSAMLDYRKNRDPFKLFLEEYEEARQSIRNKESIYWKEMLAVLSFAMNYPAKHLSAEDMIRLQKVLMPLISVVIAFTPQSSCEELIALHEAERIEIVSVGNDSEVKPLEEGGIRYAYEDESGNSVVKTYDTFIDCIGQRHLSIDDFPFRGLSKTDTLKPATIRFRSNEQGKLALKNNRQIIQIDDTYYLKVPGIAISDSFRVITKDGMQHERIHMMAVPYIGGYNPDYSGLDFCEEASSIIAKDILK